MTMSAIRTARLDLVPASPALLDAALAGPRPLAAALDAAVPPTWPPEHVDAPALEYLRARLVEDPGSAPWWLYFVLRRESPLPVLVGTAGYKGRPRDGAVEIGYSVVADHRRRGIATEAVRALLARAYAEPGVVRVIAETLPELLPSIGVLRKAGFRETGGGSGPGVLRYEHRPGMC
jgi:RimJ/RimL family protein N-acetyltransferase